MDRLEITSGFERQDEFETFKSKAWIQISDCNSEFKARIALSIFAWKNF